MGDPLRQVGGFQTEGLAMKGGNGRGYTFRKLVKHPERLLGRWWVGKRKNAVLPLRWGFLAFGESGRCGTRARARRSGTGASIANGTEGIRFYFSGGYSF